MCPLVQCQVRKVTKGLLTRPLRQSPSQAVLIHTLSISARGMGRRPHSSCGHSGKGRAGCLSICPSWGLPYLPVPTPCPSSCADTPSICFSGTPTVRDGSRGVRVSTEGGSSRGGLRSLDSNHSVVDSGEGAVEFDGLEWQEEARLLTSTKEPTGFFRKRVGLARSFLQLSIDVFLKIT